MIRNETAGHTSEKQLGAPESGIDQAIKKIKETFDGENETTEYEDVKWTDEMEDVKAHSKEVSDAYTRNNRS